MIFSRLSPAEALLSLGTFPRFWPDCAGVAYFTLQTRTSNALWILVRMLGSRLIISSFSPKKFRLPAQPCADSLQLKSRAVTPIGAHGAAQDHKAPSGHHDSIWSRHRRRGRTYSIRFHARMFPGLFVPSAAGAYGRRPLQPYASTHSHARRKQLPAASPSPMRPGAPAPAWS